MVDGLMSDHSANLEPQAVSADQVAHIQSSLEKKLATIAKNMKIHFNFKGKPISYQNVFSNIGLLPGLAKRADQLALLCLGYGVGITLEDTDKSLLGQKVKFDAYTPEVLRLLYITDVIHELAKSSPSKDAVALDELLYD
jgi:intracellular multiplication protein IcmS